MEIRNIAKEKKKLIKNRKLANRPKKLRSLEEVRPRLHDECRSNSYVNRQHSDFFYTFTSVSFIGIENKTKINQQMPGENTTY